MLDYQFIFLSFEWALDTSRQFVTYSQCSELYHSGMQGTKKSLIHFNLYQLIISKKKLEGQVSFIYIWNCEILPWRRSHKNITRSHKNITRMDKPSHNHFLEGKLVRLCPIIPSTPPTPYDFYYLNQSFSIFLER